MIQLNVCGPREDEKNIKVCDTSAQMKYMTVKQLKEKLMEELKLSTFNFFLLHKHYVAGRLFDCSLEFKCTPICLTVSCSVLKNN